MNELTIGEIARYAGINTSTIRYYESVGLLPPAVRVNGRRRYDLDILKQLGLIQLVRRAGFGIREIQALFNTMDQDNADATRWQALAREKIAEMDELIERTQATRAWLAEALNSECKGVDDCVMITLDEIGDKMDVTVCCLKSKSDDTQNTVTLMTMSQSKLE